MPKYHAKEDITAALERLNKRLHNAAVGFRVDEVGSNFVDVAASFDFAYYVNVQFYFQEVIYTSFKTKDTWPDAWHEDQLFLLTEEEMKEVLDWNEIEYTSTENLHGFLFNQAGRSEYYQGVIICKSIEILWRHPKYED